MQGQFSKEDLASHGRTQTIAGLRAELKNTDLPRHLALFFRDPDTQLEAVSAFINQGLQTNRRCLYLADVNTIEQIKTALRAADIAVERQIDTGNLILKDASEVYLDAKFDPQRLIQTLEDFCEGSVSDGYEGLWVAGENSWCFHTEVSFDHILDFEAEFDAVCPDLPVRALCQYDLNKFGEQSTAKALRTHKQVIYRHAICENPFYIPPDEYRATANPHENAQFMLEQAYSLTQARQQIHQREQRLSVVNRILRHNIRNDLNIVQGVLQSLRDDDTIGENHTDGLQIALRQVDDIIEKADKSQYVQRTLTDSSVIELDLDSVIIDAVTSVEQTHPEAEINITNGHAVNVLADENLDKALVEVLTNAVEHQNTEYPTVSLTVSLPTDDTVRLHVENPGPPIPKNESRSVQQAYETQLQHGSGLGLWLTKWIVENSNGHLKFPDGENAEEQVVIELYRTS